MNTPDLPVKLVDALKAGKCAVFVGAGLSIPAKVPNWSTLLDLLIKQGEDQGLIAPATRKELETALTEPTKFLAIAEQLADEFGSEAIQAAIAKQIRKIDPVPTDAHKDLVSMHFRHVVTTNYDLLIEDAYASVHGKTPAKFTHEDAADVAEALWESRYFVLKAHGDLQRRETIILTRRDYRRLIYRSPGYRTLLGTIFTNCKILFLGVSMQDPEINLLLEFLQDSFHSGGKNHYALMEESTVQPFEQRRWLKDYSVQVLPYKKSNDYHPEVPDFISKLRAATS